MTHALTRFLSLLRVFPDLTPEQRAQYINEPHRHFIRTSPLTFRRTVAFILQLVRKSTAVELHDFFGYLGRAPVTKSAFAQRPRAIRPFSAISSTARSPTFIPAFVTPAAGDPSYSLPWTALARPCPAKTGSVAPSAFTKKLV